MNALICSLVLAQSSLSAPPLPQPEFATPVAYAQPAAQAPSAEVVSEEPEAPRKENGVSLQMAAHIGLVELDLQVGHFYAFAAGNVGIPLLTNGYVGAITAGAGYTFALRKTSEVAWYMDLLALGNFMWLGQSPMGGFGVGLGFRMVHRSGFTMGFKIPALGGEIGGAVYGTQQAVAYFFLANAISLPVFSLGYRF